MFPESTPRFPQDLTDGHDSDLGPLLARGQWGRRKRWNHWCVTSDRAVAIMTLADLDYLGLAALAVLDRETGRWTDRLALRPLGWRAPLGDRVSGETVAGEWLGMALRFADRGDAVQLSGQARGVKIELEVRRPAGHQTVDVLIPWTERHFHFTSKHSALPASGVVTVKGRRMAISGWGCLDFGRGVPPARAHWNWASAAGVRDGRTVGLNLGGIWTDGTGRNENGLVVDGRMTRLGDVAFTRDPWTIRGAEVDLAFTPQHRKRVRAGLVSLDIGFGWFRGRVAGVELVDLYGWAEDCRLLW